MGERTTGSLQGNKEKMLKPPVLSMPDRKGRFILYLTTSKIATGSALYQHQDGKPRLIAYASKRMPEAAKNYSITELEIPLIRKA